MKLSYDYNIDANGDPLIQKVEESMSVLAQIMIPGHFLVESYPFRERFPFHIFCSIRFTGIQVDVKP